MKKIYKYRIEVTDDQNIEMPVGAKILTVQTQNGVPCILLSRCADMDKERKIERIKERGFKVVTLGKHIRASKGNEVYSGSVSYVFRMIFGY